MIRVGTAVGTNDTQLIPFLREMVYNKKLLDYVELYVQPSFKLKEILEWREEPYVIRLHAPHDSRARYIPGYLKIANRARELFQKDLPITIDAGLLFDEDAWKLGIKNIDVENMPFITWLGDFTRFCLPEEIKGRFCFDFTHAYITALMIKEDPMLLLREFLKKKPNHFHFSGLGMKQKNDHINLQDGEVPIPWVINELTKFKNPTVTIETDHEGANREKRIQDDLEFFRLFMELNAP